MVLSDCVCPGHELRLECMVVGGGHTIWKGSAFDCQSSTNRIVLRHSQFESGASKSCNNGSITGRIINTTSDSDGMIYISQLIIQLNMNGNVEGGTVECAHEDGNVIGTHTINYTRGIIHYRSN